VDSDIFLVLAVLLVPVMIMAQKNNKEVSIGVQAMIVAIASLTGQLLRRKPLDEMYGTFNWCWLKQLYVGGLIGSAFMLIPALILGFFGWVHWQWNPAGFTFLSTNLLLFAGVAVAEELLFRGFVFQRLGQWPAQLIVAAFFLLTHLNNPGMTGSVKVMANINIFLASILFGLAFIQTKSLAMPLGLHFMANLIQGGILGFGVSGTERSGLLQPTFVDAPVWLTGGQFGLEASLPGLIFVVITLLVLYMRKPKDETVTNE
jgi:membrane protease YdiL (CAAX protease family)